MPVSVLIPFAGNCPHRLAALDWLRRRLADRHPTWEVTIGEADPDAWRKAHAVEDALAQASGDTLVVHDADVWTDGLPAAVRQVADGIPWAIPHGHVHRLDEPASADVLAGAEPNGRMATHEKPYPGRAGGGIVVLTRHAWHRVPIDSRFVGWGQEDLSWALALDGTFGHPWRGSAPLWHLWHPPPHRTNRFDGSKASRRLHDRYLAVRRSPERLAALIEEGRHAPQALPGAPAPQAGHAHLPEPQHADGL